MRPKRRTFFTRVPAYVMACAAVLPVLTGLARAEEPVVEPGEPVYDGLQELLSADAHKALDRGDYVRAEHLFWRLVLINPNDARALREAGRAAQALGDSEFALRALDRANALHEGAADPELHYLRADALRALGREADAKAALAQAERELKYAPSQRQVQLWRARVHSFHRDVPRAEAIYQTQLARADVRSAEYAEVMLYLVEAHIFANNWASAEQLIRLFLGQQPNHVRGREMLAWVLEARGKLDEELTLRASLAGPAGPIQVMDYARALDRAQNEPAALARYQEARDLGVDDVSPEIARLSQRVSPELFAGSNLRRDPSGSVFGLAAAATVPITTRDRVAVVATHDTAEGSQPVGDVSTRTLMAWAVTGRRNLWAAAGLAVHQRGVSEEVGPGAALALRTIFKNTFQVQVGSEVGLPWRESASTIREGGMVSRVAFDTFASPFSQRLAISMGGQVRRFSLADDDHEPVQLLGSVGVDYTVRSDPAKAVGGEVLDGNMLWPSPFAMATVLSYRHYELTSDNPFGPRMVLVERSSIDELSGVLRDVGRNGTLGVEVRAGAGYDWARGVALWRAGGSLLLSPTTTSRLSIDYDFASESRTGLSGHRHAGMATLHVDL